jgi:transglutaminase-like putative cysteine protease
MPRHRPNRLCFLPAAALAALALTALAGPARALDALPPLTDAEKALTAVPGEPNAPAVVLIKRGEFLMAGFGQKSVSESSFLHLQVRLKILTEEGKSNGEVAITHSDFQRLHGFHGRTILPDGRVLPVSSDAKFVRKTSRSLKTFTTAVAFPAVQVGAIVEYEYELWFDSIFFLEPWYFAEEVPVRYSEITFKTPLTVAAQAWSRGPARVKIQRQTDRTSNGYITKAWAENVPSVPDDAYGPPYQDLAAQMLMVPTSFTTEYVHTSLLESWPKTCEMIGRIYDTVKRKDGDAAKTARALAPAGSPHQRAETLYRFVRDQIEDDGYIGVTTDGERSVGKVLDQHKGDRAEKALLLQAMLAAVKIDAQLVWAADRDRGAIDPALPNPRWFDTVLVRVELDGRKVYLDPTDRALAFGHLRPGHEGTPALVFDTKKPEGIVLPQTPYDQNLERAEIDLKAVAAPEEEKVTLTWSLAQREDEVLGDEVTLLPSAPLGPFAQILVQPAASRRSGVAFDYPYRQEVELRLHWPEGWKVESTPKENNLAGKAGGLSLDVESKPAERTLICTRRLDLTQRRFDTSAEYEAVRSLFADVEKSDAQRVVLVHK